VFVDVMIDSGCQLVVNRSLGTGLEDLVFGFKWHEDDVGVL
jgi:hypothetical protein